MKRRIEAFTPPVGELTLESDENVDRGGQSDRMYDMRNTITVRVDDAAGHSATVNRSIAVGHPLAIAGVCTSATPCAVEQGCITVCGMFASLRVRSFRGKRLGQRLADAQATRWG